MVLERLEDFADSHIDDMIVFSDSWEEHLQHLRQVLERLRRHKLTAKPSKCKWGAKSLQYLGRRKVPVPEVGPAKFSEAGY